LLIPILWLAATCVAAWGQPSPGTVYQAFFRQVTTSQGNTLYPALPAAPIVLTEQEGRGLRAVAAACKAKLDAVFEAIKSARLEVLYQTIESGRPGEKSAQRLASLEAQEARIAIEHFQVLKTVFVNERFETLRDFVHGWDPEGRSPFVNEAELPRRAR
jgi:hypothetical protein